MAVLTSISLNGIKYNITPYYQFCPVSFYGDYKASEMSLRLHFTCPNSYICNVWVDMDNSVRYIGGTGDGRSNTGGGGFSYVFSRGLDFYRWFTDVDHRERKITYWYSDAFYIWIWGVRYDYSYVRFRPDTTYTMQETDNHS